jgi:NhaA family Na+:H+ antiporter
MQAKSLISRPQTRPLAALLLRPFQAFVQIKSSSGLLLLFCTCVALLWANSPWSTLYHQVWEQHLTIQFVTLRLDLSLHEWINDGLMTIFFLLVGLEIKRELLVGELSQIRQAILPIIAAVGGACVPALLYILINRGNPAAAGWGIPMATDIAFALGIVALLGKRIPLPLKVFLVALAIMDDLLAVLIIALFYSHGINVLALAVSGGLIICLLGCNVLGIRRPIVYGVLGILLWLAVWQSGIHATISGVLLAFTIPVRSRIDASTFVQQSRAMLDTFEQGEAPGVGLLMDEQQQGAVAALAESAEAVQTPLQRIEHALNFPVSFGIIPLFVLANAGVSLNPASFAHAILSPVTLGVAVGLVFGKQIGIFLSCWFLVKLRWTQLPDEVTWRHIYGASWLGGVGFTMSIFIANLAFAAHDPTFLDEAKIGILLAFVVASVGGYLVLRSINAPTGSSEMSIQAAKPNE